MRFIKAVRKAAKARIALAGPSGSGKTWGALTLAAGLGGRVAVIDAEKGSASLYAGLEGIPEFEVLELSAPYTPERYIEAMKAAAAEGIDTLIIDGITPEWSGVGGCMELVDQIAAAKYRGNGWSAWSEVTPRHRKFIDAMLSYPGHLIATMRSKTETAQEEKNGRKSVVKLGMKAEQRDGMEYEFTAVLDLVHGTHAVTATKDRTRLWSDTDPAQLTTEHGTRLREWLDSGDDTPVRADPAMVEKALQAMAEAQRFHDLKNHYDAALAMATGDAEATARIEAACASAKARITADRAQRVAGITGQPSAPVAAGSE